MWLQRITLNGDRSETRADVLDYSMGELARIHRGLDAKKEAERLRAEHRKEQFESDSPSSPSF
ncbi:MAG: hypothetical protein ABEL76_15605 [Bradymonadaceae bacterium]